MIASAVKEHDQFKNYRLTWVVGILMSHEDEIMESVKLTTNEGPLTLVVKVKKSKEKVVVADSNFDATDDEFTS